MYDTLTTSAALLSLVAAPSGEGRWPRIYARSRSQAWDERERAHVL